MAVVFLIILPAILAWWIYLKPKPIPVTNLKVMIPPTDPVVNPPTDPVVTPPTDTSGTGTGNTTDTSGTTIKDGTATITTRKK